MTAMARYELKKVFGSFGSKLALLLLAGLVLLSSWMAVSGVEWVNEKGDQETGFSAISRLREAQRRWAGPLDETRLEAIIRENQRICATPEAQSKDYNQNDIAYGWKQGIRPVLDMMNYAYSNGFQEFDWYCNERVTPGQAGDFYPNRTRLMKQWLYEEGSSAYHLFNEKEKDFLVAQYEALETPFYYDYSEGWTQLLYNSPFVIMTTALILGYLVAGIFAGEFRWKTDTVLFSTLYGRDRAVSAKIKAGFLLVTGLYWTSVALYFLITMTCLGFSGWNCPLQLDLWKSFYQMKLWQAWLLVSLGGYIGNLFFSFLTMWVSARTRSSMFAATVPFLLIFLPSFLDNLNNDRISKILGLFPSQLLELYQALRYFYVYDLGFTVTDAMHILPVAYGIMSLLLIPAMYREYRRYRG